MATKSIAWESGSGYISLSYTGTGNGSISITSDANDSFENRQQTVRIATSTGSPAQAVDLLVRQKGKSVPVGTVYDFAYTGTVQEVTLPKGKYKLQCWGAQGGTSSSGSATGSKGGYSEGVITLTKTTTLYVFVGGKGASSGNGGWNGGGGASGSTSYESGDTYGCSYYACGGGATDICTVTSDMTYSSKRNNRSSASLLSRCIVAGGGAGGSYRYTEVTTTTDVTKSTVVTSGTIDASTSTETVYKNVWFWCPKDSYYVGSISAGGTFWIYDEVTGGVYDGHTLTSNQSMSINMTAAPGTICTYSVTRYYITTTTSTSTSSGKSNSAQQGGGTSGLGQYPGTQTSAGNNGAFGLGANQTVSDYRYSGGAGGGGWYGGGSAYSDSSTSYVNYSGGGSGFVNTAANASSRPSGYTGLQLDSGTTTAGNSSFPSTSGGTETGHSGNGYAKITKLE